jgi:RNA polymerase sigma-70 factor (ECF subfamily)
MAEPTTFANSAPHGAALVSWQPAEASKGDVASLVERAQAGDHAAFGQLYDVYQPKILTYFRYHLQGRPEQAEDLAADVFVKALDKLATYRDSGVAFQAWLYRIAHNHLVDHFRGHARRPSVSLDDQFDASDPSADRDLETTLDQQHLAAAMDALTAEQRQVILYRFMEGRSIADTARRMGKQEDAVKQLQVRGIRSLRQSLAA